MNLTTHTTALQNPHVPQQATATKNTKGFTLIELLAVIAIGGVMAAAGAAYFSDAYKLGDVSYLASTADRLNQNWRLGTSKCGVSSNVDDSPVTTLATAAAHLTLLVEGTGFDTKYEGCWKSTGIEPARTAGIKGTSLTGYTAQGYVISIKNESVDNRNRMAVTFKNVEDATVLELIQKYGSQATAANMSDVPLTDDTADKTVQFKAIASGYHDVTLIK